MDNISLAIVGGWASIVAFLLYRVSQPAKQSEERFQQYVHVSLTDDDLRIWTPYDQDAVTDEDTLAAINLGKLAPGNIARFHAQPNIRRLVK